MDYSNKLNFEELSELFNELKSKILELSKDSENGEFIYFERELENLVPCWEKCTSVGNYLFLKPKDENQSDDNYANVFMNVEDNFFQLSHVRIFKQFDELEDVFIKFMLRHNLGNGWKKQFINYKANRELETIGYHAWELKNKAVEFCNVLGDELSDEQNKLCEIVDDICSNDANNHYLTDKVLNTFRNKIVERVERVESEISDESENNNVR